MTKTTIELLKDAREWLSMEEHWCGYEFQNWRGANCSLGVLGRVSSAKPLLDSAWMGWLNDHEIQPPIRRLAAAARHLGERDVLKDDHTVVVEFNNLRGWRPTLAMFDLAIKMEQEEMDRQAKELVESSVGEAVAK